MNKDWGKAIAQLCVIAQNNTDLKEPVLQYTEFMKTVYGIDGADFLISTENGNEVERLWINVKK